jgi:hypothetical protein
MTGDAAVKGIRDLSDGTIAVISGKHILLMPGLP